MHPNFHLSKNKNVTITLQTERENPLKVCFCFQTEDKIVIYVSTRGHWDCTTLQHHCTTFGFASGYTAVLQGGTISMPTGRHVDNLYCSVFTRIILNEYYNTITTKKHFWKWKKKRFVLVLETAWVFPSLSCYWKGTTNFSM